MKKIFFLLFFFGFNSSIFAQKSINTTIFYSIIGINGLAMQASGANNEDKLIQAKPTAADNQLWQFIKIPSKGYRIFSKIAPNKCITMDEADFAVLYDVDNQADQLFEVIVITGRGTIIASKTTNLAFSIKDGDKENSSVFQLANVARSPNSVWKCVPQGESATQPVVTQPVVTQPTLTQAAVKIGAYTITLFSEDERIQANTAKNSSFMSQEEKDFIFIMNLSRIDGTKFEKCFLDAYIANSANSYLVGLATSEINSLRQELRNSKNTPLLLPYEKLSQSTAFHTNEMKDREYSINSVDGTSFGDRILRYIPNSYVGEIFTCGMQTPADAVLMLMIDYKVADLHHRRIILNTHSFGAGQAPINWRRVGTSVRDAPTGTWMGRSSKKLFLADFGSQIPGDNP